MSNILSKEVGRWTRNSKRSIVYIMMSAVDLFVLFNVLSLNLYFAEGEHWVIRFFPSVIFLLLFYSLIKKTPGMKIFGFKLSSHSKKLTIGGCAYHLIVWAIMYPVFWLQLGIKGEFLHEKITKFHLDL